MTEQLEHKRSFRLSQSREKIQLSQIMLNKQRYNESVIYSYLSMFYSVRLLLIGAEDDTDNEEKILELAEKYYEPAGWTSLDILGILRETKEFHDQLNKSTGKIVSQEEAERFYNNALSVMIEVTRQSGTEAAP